MLPVAGEYTSAAVTKGRRGVPAQATCRSSSSTSRRCCATPSDPASPFAAPVDADAVLPRPPGPVHRLSGAADLQRPQARRARDRRSTTSAPTSAATCSRSTPPFNLGATTMGYGLGSAGAAALNSKDADRGTIAIMGDGGFWHNGLTSGVGNAVFNKNDQLLVVVDNDYAAATGGQDVLSSQADNAGPLDPAPDREGGARRRRRVGADDRRHLRRHEVRDSFLEALTHRGEGPEGARDAERVPAQPPAPRQAEIAPGAQGRQAGRARALRRRRGDLHRRPRLHPDLRLPVADDQAQPRPPATATRSRRSWTAASAAASAGPTRTRRCCARRFYRTDVVQNPTKKDERWRRIRSRLDEASRLNAASSGAPPGSRRA